MRDLTFFNEGNPKHLSNGLINFSKLRALVLKVCVCGWRRVVRVGGVRVEVSGVGVVRVGGVKGGRSQGGSVRGGSSEGGRGQSCYHEVSVLCRRLDT